MRVHMVNRDENTPVKITNFDVTKSLKKMTERVGAFKTHKAGLLTLLGISMWTTLLATLTTDARFLLLSIGIIGLVMVIFVTQRSMCRRALLKLEHQYCFGLVARTLTKIQILPEEKIVRLFFRYNNGISGSMSFPVSIQSSESRKCELDLQHSVFYITDENMPNVIEVMFKYT